MKEHRYDVTVYWTGNLGAGTSGYRAYARDDEIAAPGKPVCIHGSSDSAFRGDGERYSPEELLVAALSACHMLWVLHLAADAGIVITSYQDAATGTMVESEDGSGRFAEVRLHPRMTITDGSRLEQAEALHQKAHALCFIARSVNFAVIVEPVIAAG